MTSQRNRWVLAVVAAALLTGCSSNDKPSQLGIGGEQGSKATGAIPHVHANVPYVINLLPLCAKTGGPITITNVELVNTTPGMQLIGWGVRERTNGDQYSNGNNDPGALPGLLNAVPGFNHHPVKTTCTNTNASTEFDVNVQMNTGNVATATFQVDYKDGHKTGHLIDPYTLSLCRAECPATP